MTDNASQWTAEDDDDGVLLWWSPAGSGTDGWGLTADDLATDEVGFGADAAAAFADLVGCVSDSGLLAQIRQIIRAGHIGPDGPDADDSVVLGRIADLLGES